MLRKKGENEIFNIAALHGAYICQIFCLLASSLKTIWSFFTARFNWSPKINPHPSDYLLELQLILVDFLAEEALIKSYPKK